jgi:hypothetical protein
MKAIARLLAFLGIASVLGAVWARATRVPDPAVTDPAADEIKLAAIFEPLVFHGTSKAFRGGTLDCWFGGGVLDLRDAELDPAGARLVVRALFGGGQILVPAQWRVTSSVWGLGGLTDQREAVDRAPDAPTLAIEGTALFGGFAVSSRITEDEARGLELAKAWQRR